MYNAAIFGRKAMIMMPPRTVMGRIILPTPTNWVTKIMPPLIWMAVKITPMLIKSVT